MFTVTSSCSSVLRLTTTPSLSPPPPHPLVLSLTHFTPTPFHPIRSSSLTPSTPPSSHPLSQPFNSPSILPHSSVLPFHSKHPPMLLSFVMERREGAKRKYSRRVGFFCFSQFSERGRESGVREGGVSHGLKEAWNSPSELALTLPLPHVFLEYKAFHRYIQRQVYLWNYSERDKVERQGRETNRGVYWQTLGVNHKHWTLKQTVDYYWSDTFSLLPVGCLRIRYVQKWRCSFGSDGVAAWVWGHMNRCSMFWRNLQLIDPIYVDISVKYWEKSVYIISQQRKENRNWCVFTHSQRFCIHDPLQTVNTIRHGWKVLLSRQFPNV